MSVEKYRCNVDKKANKVASIPRSILLYESIVDIDIDTSKVSSIISTSISIFDINNPVNKYCPSWYCQVTAINSSSVTYYKDGYKLGVEILLLDTNKMASVEVIEDVARSGTSPMSPEDINEESKKLAEEIKEKANACFKSSDLNSLWYMVLSRRTVRSAV